MNKVTLVSVSVDRVNVAAKGVFGLADSVITGVVVIVGGGLKSVSLSQAPKSSAIIMSAGVTERGLASRRHNEIALIR